MGGERHPPQGREACGLHCLGTQDPIVQQRLMGIYVTSRTNLDPGVLPPARPAAPLMGTDMVSFPLCGV